MGLTNIAGACHRVGVQQEQLWALLKAPASVARYMSLPNFHDFYEAVFSLVNVNKARAFLTFLVGNHKAVYRKLGGCQGGVIISMRGVLRGHMHLVTSAWCVPWH